MQLDLSLAFQVQTLDLLIIFLCTAAVVCFYIRAQWARKVCGVDYSTSSSRGQTRAFPNRGSGGAIHRPQGNQPRAG